MAVRLYVCCVLIREENRQLRKTQDHARDLQSRLDNLTKSSAETNALLTQHTKTIRDLTDANNKLVRKAAKSNSSAAAAASAANGGAGSGGGSDTGLMAELQSLKVRGCFLLCTLCTLCTPHMFLTLTCVFVCDKTKNSIN